MVKQSTYKEVYMLAKNSEAKNTKCINCEGPGRNCSVDCLMQNLQDYLSEVAYILVSLEAIEKNVEEKQKVIARLTESVEEEGEYALDLSCNLDVVGEMVQKIREVLNSKIAADE